MAAELVWLSQSTIRDDIDTDQLIYIVVHNFIKSHDPAAAIALTHDWQMRTIQQEGTETRTAVAVAENRILERMDRSDSFDESLSTWPTIHAAEARKLRQSRPIVERLVANLADPGSRAAILNEWGINLPSWLLDADADVLCWLGSIAASYGQNDAGSSLFLKAVEAGASPRAYWMVRVALCQSASSESQARETLAGSAGSHPLGSAALAALNGERRDAQAILANWDASSHEDISIKAGILARILIQLDDLNGAINITRITWDQIQPSGIGILLAGCLLQRASRGESTHRLADTEQALDIALRVRNARRVWHGDSAEAAALAIRAANMFGDSDHAWAISQSPPEGEALEREASDGRVIDEGAVTASLTGRFDRARHLAALSPNPFAVAYVNAILAEYGESEEYEGPDGLQRAWQRTWDVATTIEEKAQAAHGIADSGGILPDLSELQEVFPEAVEEIRLLQHAVSDGPDRIVRLRANAHKSRLIAVKLAAQHVDGGRPDLAAEVLRDAADRWDDLQLLSFAARRYKDAGMREEAKATASTCLARGGSTWPGARDMYILLIEVNSAEGYWEDAVHAARGMVNLDPTDDDAIWALTRCLVYRGALDEAWSALSDRGTPLRPRTREEAITWIHLNSRYSEDLNYVDSALGVMASWPEDEQLLGVFLATIYHGLRREEIAPSAEDLARLHEATQSYVGEFPDSPFFRQISLGPPESPLQPFEEMLRLDHTQFEEIFAMAQAGQLPVGILSEVAGSSHTEACIKRAAGLVFAVEPGGDALEDDAVEAAATSSRVVIDVSALVTLAILPAELLERLLGSLSAVVTTDEIYRDALRARDALVPQSTLRMSWDPEASRAGVVEVSEEMAREWAVTAQRVVSNAGGISRTSHPELRHFPEISDAGWLNALDFAKEGGAVCWSDDRVMRQLARGMDVATFGTHSLLNHLSRREAISQSEVEVAVAVLIRHHYVDIGFNERVMELAAVFDGWRARGASVVLSRPIAWQDPEAAIGLVFRALESVHDSPDEIYGWAASAALGLVRSVSNSALASRNLVVLLGRLLTQSWVGSLELRAILGGLRVARNEREGVEDPLSPVLQNLHRKMVDRHGHAMASQLIMRLMSATDEPDRQLAAKVILLSKGTG